MSLLQEEIAEEPEYGDTDFSDDDDRWVSYRQSLHLRKHMGFSNLIICRFLLLKFYSCHFPNNCFQQIRGGRRSSDHERGQQLPLSAIDDADPDPAETGMDRCQYFKYGK